MATDKVTQLALLVKKAYHSSPATWLSELKTRQKYRLLRKRKGIRLARILDDKYFARRDHLIQNLIQRVIQMEDIYTVIQGFAAKEYDERVVEYPYFVSWLLQNQSGVDLLDVGCVLNNKMVASVLLERCRAVWFCNVVIEPEIHVKNPVYYHVAPLEEAFVDNEQLPLVVCLSTIEHMGYDNSQYGCSPAAKYQTATLEPLETALRKLAQITSRGGGLLVSFPFGFREVLIHPLTGKIASQVFDYAALQHGLSVLESEGVASEYEVFAVGESGWRLVEAQNCNVRYADGCPAASAVALIKGSKEA